MVEIESPDSLRIPYEVICVGLHGRDHDRHVESRRARIGDRFGSRCLRSVGGAGACRRCVSMLGRTLDLRNVAHANLDKGPRPKLPGSIPILIALKFQDFDGLPFDSPLFEAAP